MGLIQDGSGGGCSQLCLLGRETKEARMATWLSHMFDETTAVSTRTKQTTVSSHRANIDLILRLTWYRYYRCLDQSVHHCCSKNVNGLQSIMCCICQTKIFILMRLNPYDSLFSSLSPITKKSLVLVFNP